MRLKGKVALISGGAKGQGKVEAQLFSKEGAKVILGDILDDLGQEVAKDIQDTGGEATYVHLDVTNETDWKSSIEIVLKKYGRLDILVNNAGILIRKGIEDTTSEDWSRIMAINAKGAFLGIKSAIPVMRQSGGGSIINISSTYGVIAPDQRIYGTSGQNSSAFYASTKSALINLTRYLASYWNRKGIRVNTLSPGGVENNQDPKFIKKYSEKTMIGRMAQKDEYIGALIFLCSDASSYMTGSNLIIDGGWTAW